MKIGILGTRGIPNHYGGFEQFAESLSKSLVKEKHNVYVYNSSTHPFQQNVFNGVNIIHCFDPENRIGTIGQFIYDLNCIMDAKHRNFDIILQLGYTSNSIWGFLLPKKALIITNMDGLEWKREKYNNLTKSFLKFAEKLAVKRSDYLIADSIGIQNYLKNKYNVSSKYIGYGTKLFNAPDKSILDLYKVKDYKYNILIARFEPENNLETILDGFVNSKSNITFLVIGNNNNKYGKYLKLKYKKDTNVVFIGGLYNKNHLDNLRYYSNLYFHGHSVGGTNPSLIEAMGSSALIIAHDNEFNKSILKEDGFYFKTPNDINRLIQKIKKSNNLLKMDSNIAKINTYYNTANINKEYLTFFNACKKKY
ncbi:MAG: DUF1972 domain-containing protein [Flavobacteriaceae bacterium]|nr:DUF1972 domain-containing protein [Flavobacteriaceae bacterium]